MAIRREWLDWNEPCLPRAAQWLADHASALRVRETPAHFDAKACDLRAAICVVPGRRAARLLLAELIRVTAGRGLRLVPPRVLTPGAMVDAVLGIDAPVATAWESHCAWIAALRNCGRETLGPLVPESPEPDDVAAWDELARMISRLHEDLAGGRVSFERVAEETERLEMLAEGDRWRALTAIRERYFKVLARHGLADAHQAREESLRKGRTGFDGWLALISTVELNAIQRAAVQAVADRATALVFAPQRLADRFDDMGCVVAEAWREVPISVRDEQIVLVDRPDDQAQAAIRAIAALDGQYGPDEISIGLGDAALAPTMIRHAAWAGLEVRSPVAATVARSAPARLLACAADWLDDPRFSTLAAMLRHPDIEDFVQRTAGQAGAEDWQTVLDEYFSRHLNQRISDKWLGSTVRAMRMKAAHGAVAAMLAPLTGGEKTRRLGDWAQPVLDVLAGVYGGRNALHADEAAFHAAGACVAIRDAVAEFVAVAPELQPRATAAEAVRLILKQVHDAPLPGELAIGQIEMLGWLELHLDIAPALIITGCNDGTIPEAVQSDAFLPDSLRARLGLQCNDRRRTRDAYYMEAVNHSRRHVTFIAGRHAAAGDPLTPSRLLLACPEGQLVQRIARMCDGSEGKPGPRGLQLPIGLSPRDHIEQASLFAVPELPADLPLPDRMHVTWFRKYLECPYRFALEHLLGLEGVSDAALEMDGLIFGSVAHEALRRFGEDAAIAGSTDAARIEAYLVDAVRRGANEQFGSRPMMAVRIQLSRLEQRLARFAEKQAEHRSQGWVIRHVEMKIESDNLLEIPGQAPMPLVGKVDRIDFNEGNDTWMIIDYKSGDSARTPHQTHHGGRKVGGQWVDLQLPLYHYLCGRNGITGEVSLAYFLLPKDLEQTRLEIAAWTGEHLAGAVETAREVVRGIRARKFPRSSDVPREFDAFARICQSAAYGDDGADEGEAGWEA